MKNITNELVQKGLLDKFIKKDSKKPWNIFKKEEKRPEGDSEKKQDKPMILVIYGGSSEGGEASRKRKHWATFLFVGSVQAETVEKKQRRESLYFTDNDLPRGKIDFDSLVIIMDMEGTNVECIIVHTGNNVNILYKEVFDKLDIDKLRLMPTQMPRSGFTGDQVEAEDMVELDVELRM